MKSLSSFVLPSILTIALTISPVMAQTSARSTTDVTVAVEQTVASASSSRELDQKNVGDAAVLANTPSSKANVPVVFPALPPSDSSDAPGRTSRAAVVAVIIGGAAIVAAII